MRQIIIQAFIVGIVVLAFMFLIGCSTSIIVKDCEEKSSTESGKQICKTLKPWE